MRINTKRLAGNLGVRQIQVRAAIRWLQQGYNVAYLAYYGRTRVGGLSETALREIARYLEEQKRLDERKQSVLKHIEGQERLTEELRESIERADDAPQLEELFFPFKQPQETPADQAHLQGLGKVADAIWKADPIVEHLQELLPRFVNPDVGLNSPEEVLEGVRHLLAERLAQVWRWRRVGRKALRDTAVVVARRNSELSENEGQEFRDFFHFRAPVRKVKAYELLALVRGERQRALSLEIEYDHDKVRSALSAEFPITEHAHLELIRSAAAEAMDSYLIPALVSELRRRLYQRAEEYAAKVMGDYLRRLLLLRPMSGYRVLAIDPALRPGCRIAVLDENGNVLDCRILHLLEGHKTGRGHGRQDRETASSVPVAEGGPTPTSTEGTGDGAGASPPAGGETSVAPEGASQHRETAANLTTSGHDAQFKADVEQLGDLVRRFDVQVIVIGNNNHAREVESLVIELIGQRLGEVQYSMIPDLGAAQYAGSVLGKEELPNLDAGLRLAVSLGRRFQDFLAELTKVDIPSLVGHLNWYDISMRRAQDTVRHALESVVNWVGVDVNQASAAQLRYVAGLNEHLARNLVDYRKQHGPFRRREQLMQVPGMTEMIYRQASAFLRIPDGEEPLDATWLHPEQYELAQRLLQHLGFTAQALKEPFRRRELRQALSRLNLRELAEQWQCSAMTLREVANHLAAAGRDPRAVFPGPVLRQRLLGVDELRPGRMVPGLVVRVTDFGAFLDIGAEETALLHKSRFGHHGFHSPREVIGVGEMRNVWIVQVDAANKRIGLSLVPPVARRRARVVRRRRRPEVEVARPTPPVVMQIQSPTVVARSVVASTEVATSESRPLAVAETPAAEQTGDRPQEAAVEPTQAVTVSEVKPEKAPETAEEAERRAATPPQPGGDTPPIREKPTMFRPMREATVAEVPLGVLSGKRQLRTFAELKAFYEARQRLQSQDESQKTAPASEAAAPAHPAAGRDDNDAATS
ncbi:MAG: Tex-like N-terminal domain-containing protein [Gemmatales bacterium]|nr:Tex-like N-terminal domain-containing protein [Gemmatales bacterium]